MGDYRNENPFLLLDDENEDPQALVKSAPAKSGTATKAAATAGKSDTAIKTDTRQAGRAPGRRDLLGEGSTTVEASGERGRGRGPRGGRGRGGRGRGDYGDRPPREYGDRPQRDYGDRPPREYGDRPPRRNYDRPAGEGDVSEGIDESGVQEGGRGGGRFGGRGRGRGRGSGRNFYDRHDNTGRGHEFVKRGGAGKGNWGTEGDDSQEQGAPDESKPELRGENANVPGEELPNGNAPHADVAGEAEEEEEAPTMTLDEWEKMQAEKRAALKKEAAPAKVDLKQFEGMAVVDRPDPEEDALDLTAVKALGKKKQGFEKEKKTKQVVEDVGFKFANDAPRGGRGGRGGRGRGGRGGRGYGGYERSDYGGGRSDYGGGRGRSDANVAQLDGSAFPALA